MATREASAEPNKPRRTLKILVPLVTLLIMLVLLELGLQLLSPLPFSDKLYWLSDGHTKARPEPHQELINVAGNPVRINHLGLRGADWSWRPAPGTLRLITLGGSSTFCFQVTDDEHTWPAVLERQLAAWLGMPVEVANLGLPGYDTANSKVNYLFTGRALEPHVVLVYHTWNDMKFLRPIDESDGLPRAVLSGKPSHGVNQPLAARIFRRLQVVRRIDRALTRMRKVDRENRYTSLEQLGERAHKPVGERAWGWFRKNFEDVALFVRTDRRLPVLISQASLIHRANLDNQEYRLAISNDWQGMTHPRLVDSWERATQIIAETARAEDAVYVDGYSAVPNDLEHLKDHVHLLDPGARVLADAIADTLLADARFTEIAERVRTSGAAASK